MPITLDAILNETATEEFPFANGIVVVEFFRHASPAMRANARERYGWDEEELKLRAAKGDFDESVIATLAARIIKWDITDAEGKEVAVSEDILKRSTDEFLIELCRVVLGWKKEPEEDGRPTQPESS